MADDDASQPYPDPEAMDLTLDAAVPHEGDFSKQQNNRCCTCFSWWLFFFFALFQFIFGIACLAGASNWNHDAGIAFGIVVLLFLVVFLIVRRRDITLCKNRACGAPDPHIDETIGRSYPCIKALCFAIFVFIAFLFALIAFIMAAIYWQSPDPNWTAFPASCPGSVHCARVTVNGASGIDNLIAPTYNATPAEILDYAAKWVNSKDTVHYERTAILLKTDTFLHARFMTGFWGFACDFAVLVTCNNDSFSVVSAHSESRVSTGGPGNPNDNPDRLREFYQALAAASAKFTTSGCSSGIVPPNNSTNGGNGTDILPPNNGTDIIPPDNNSNGTTGNSTNP